MKPLNDWDLKKLLTLCGVVTTCQIALILLALCGIDIHVIRQINGFILVTIVPGILLMRILRIHNINISESIVYTVGLSLALIMFSGAAITFILPQIKIGQPLSSYPIITTLVIEIAVLMPIAWLRDRKYSNNSTFRCNLHTYLNPILFLLLLLALVVLGTKINDLMGNNVILIICLLAISAIIVFSFFINTAQSGIFPFAVFIISLCLLFQTTLMSPYLVGTDIYTEYGYFRGVEVNGLWDYSIANPVNSCLSIVILAPYYSSVLDISGIWVFKTIYPLLFSLVPVVIFRIFRLQTGANSAFLATFFFMIMPSFSLEMISLCRQQIAELFFVLSIFLLVENKLKIRHKLALFIIFNLCVTVSHYSLAFINLAYLVLLLPLIWIIRSGVFMGAWRWVTSRSGGVPSHLTVPHSGSLTIRMIIIPVVTCLLFTFIWDRTIASGVNLAAFNYLWHEQTGNLIQGIGHLMITPFSNSPITQWGQKEILIRTAFGLDFGEASLQGQIFRLFQYLTQLFIIIGCIRLVVRPRGLHFVVEFIALSIISALLLAGCVLLPNFAYIINTSRWYHITLIILAIYAVLGCAAMWNLLTWLAGKLHHGLNPAIFQEESRGFRIFIVLIMLIPYFLFTSGLVYEITGQDITDKVDNPYSIALSSHRLDLAGVASQNDYSAAGWLSEKTSPLTKTYIDANAWKMLALNEYAGHLSYFQKNGMLDPADYIFFLSNNAQNSEVSFANSGKPGLRDIVKLNDYPALTEMIVDSNRIYSNGGPVIYKTR